MIRILNVEPQGYCDDARLILNKVGQVVEDCLNREDLIRQLHAYDVLITRLAHQVDREVIDSGTRLRAIVTATTGLDHIDVDYADARGIAVLSLRGEFEFLRTICATAEHTWALLLALLRRIPQAFTSVLEGNWNRNEFRGNELNGKLLGILGLGRVGRQVADYGLAFGMKVAAYDPYATEWVDGVERVAKLHDLLRRGNVISLHLPLNGETQQLIGDSELTSLPSGSILVNTSRGELLDEMVLVRALETGHLAGAALDVIQHERNPDKLFSSPLLSYARTHDNLLITPHVAGATHESMSRTEVFMAGKLVAFLGVATFGRGIG